MTDEEIKANQSFAKCLYVKSKNRYAEILGGILKQLYVICIWIKEILLSCVRLVYMHIVDVFNYIATIVIAFYTFTYISNTAPHPAPYEVCIVFAILCGVAVWIFFTRHLTTPLQEAYVECLKERGWDWKKIKPPEPPEEKSKTFTCMED